MSDKIKKGLDFLKTGQGFLLFMLAPFFFKGETNHRILQLKLELALKNKIKKMVDSSADTILPTNINSAIQNIDNNSIWFMWLQGIEEAPELVKNNFFYLKKNFGDRVQLITATNIEKYINVPEFVYLKWKNNIISNTHFSDIIRIQLLVTYGGIWIDSTVITTEKFINFIDDQTFVIPRTFPPGSNGKVIPVSSWFIKADKNNEYLVKVQYKLMSYWIKENHLITYFLLHYILVITSEEMNNYLGKTFPVDNTLPHYLMLKMREEKLSVNEIEYLIDQFEINKFTNKTVSTLEDENYVTLNRVVRTKESNGDYTAN